MWRVGSHARTPSRFRPRRWPRSPVALWAALVLFAGCNSGGGQGRLAWTESIRRATAEAEKTHRPVLLYFAEDRNEWCRRLEKQSFRDPEAERLLRQFILVRVRPEKDPAAPARHSVFLYPSLLILDYRGEEVRRITGFRTGPQLARELAAARPADPRAGGEHGPGA